MDKSTLGDRMKGYERVSKNSLMCRTPVIIRLDGKAFHTYTRKCDKPFDTDLHWLRSNTLKYLCENIQGCIMGYSQSDEITLVLKDWQTFSSQAWFGNEVQKICSVTASMASAKWANLVGLLSITEEDKLEKFPHFAIFDARCFNLPISEVVNCLLWRQQDWERNSVQMIARSVWSQKQCHGKSNRELITRLEVEKGIIWGQLPTWQKRGEFWFRGDLRDAPRFNEARDWLEEALYQQDEE